MHGDQLVPSTATGLHFSGQLAVYLMRRGYGGYADSKEWEEPFSSFSK